MLMHSKITVVGRGDPAGRPQNLAGTGGRAKVRPYIDLTICCMTYLHLLSLGSFDDYSSKSVA